MSSSAKKMLTVTLLGLTLTASSYLFALNNNANANHAVFVPKDIKWATGPDALPKGAEVVILEGDPSKSGPFTLRLKVPANYRIPPHWHPVIEHVTVISGDFYIGMGDKFDEKVAIEMPTGSFAYMQPKMNHFAFTHEPAIVQLHGNGPWGITYVNPQDDPRNKKQQTQ